MSNFNIHYAGAWNFLCFGPDGIELNFKDYGPVVLVRGLNLDVKSSDSEKNMTDEEDQERLSSNGTGKSSIPSILSFAWFGKTIKNNKKIKADQVCHNLIGRKCKVEIRWGDFRVVRTRRPASLKLWESPDHIWNDDTEITQGTMEATQQKIQDKLGLSFESFMNICVFTDDQRMSFLESDTPVKREIVENLLSLTKYREWHQAVNELLKEAKKTVKARNSELEVLLGIQNSAEDRIAKTKEQEKTWKNARLAELKRLIQQIKESKEKLTSSDQGQELLRFHEAQERIQEINKLLSGMDITQQQQKELLKKAEEKLTLVNQQIQKHNNLLDVVLKSIRNCEREIKENQGKADGFNSDGITCDVCYETVREDNFKRVIQAKIDKSTAELIEYQSEQKKLEEKLVPFQENQKKLNDGIARQRKKIEVTDKEIRQFQQELTKLVQIREPKSDSDQLLLEQNISELKKQAQEKKAECDGPSPYISIIEDAKQELQQAVCNCENKKQEVKQIQEELPYYEYWLKAFGDKGIRKMVIDGVIPILNSRINYWLQFLIENKIQLNFDNELEELIERNPVDGDPFVYHAMSTGERRRLNLAVSQAFAHVMSISTGTDIPLVFLDEVTTNIDPLGVQGVYSMICELSQDKQVFVTTHDHDLLRMLENADVLRLQKYKGITRMLNSK